MFHREIFIQTCVAVSLVRLVERQEKDVREATTTLTPDDEIHRSTASYRYLFRARVRRREREAAEAQNRYQTAGPPCGVTWPCAVNEYSLYE